MLEEFQIEIEKLCEIKNGFKPMEKLSARIINSNYEAEDLFKASKELYSNEDYQIRMLAVFIIGEIVHVSKDYENYLKVTMSEDSNWRVQEIIAKAFDRYCANIGYECSIHIIETWLNDSNANVRRAVTEGLRVWTSRPYFKKNPEKAIAYLGNLKQDSSEYVRKSVGNALRDISKKYPKEVLNELNTWKTSDKKIKQVYNLAIKHLEKSKFDIKS